MKESTFRYYPNIYADEALVHADSVCQCCGKKVHEYIEFMYTEENVDCICLPCIRDGSAAVKFQGEFIAAADWVSDSAKREELFHRTPGYISIQDVYWLACCDDYCQFWRYVDDINDLDELGCQEELLQEYAQRKNSHPLDFVRKYLHRDWDVRGYLFKCMHCGKYHLWVDVD